MSEQQLKQKKINDYFSKNNCATKIGEIRDILTFFSPTLKNTALKQLVKICGALHFRDNVYLDDLHTLLGLSKMNREETTKALAEK